MINRQRIDVPLQIKSVDDAGEFSGYGSVFGVEDSYGDVVVRGAFEQSLSEYAEKGRLPSMLWQHRMDEPIGVYTKMSEDDNGLYVEGRLLVDDDPQAKRAHAHMKAGSLSGLSIGYTLPDGWEYDSEKDVFILRQIDLWEVSLVTFPANDEARVQDVKAALSHGETPPPNKVERLLRDAGFSRRQAKQIMASGYKALVPRDAEAGLEELAKLNRKIRGLTNA